MDDVNDVELKTQLNKDMKLLEHRISANTTGFDCIICWGPIHSSDPVISTCCWQLFCHPCAVQYFTKNSVFEKKEFPVNMIVNGRWMSTKETNTFPSVSAPCCRKELWAPLTMQYSKVDLSKILRDSITFFAHIRIFVYAPHVNYEKFRTLICAWPVEYDSTTWSKIRHKSHVLIINDMERAPKIMNRILDYIDMIMVVDMQQANDIIDGMMRILKRKKSAINVIHFYAPMMIK